MEDTKLENPDIPEQNLKTSEESSGKHGGRRPGSGRKPKLKAETRATFYVAIDERWPLIMQNLDKWIREGDKEMIKFVIEQRIGKAPQGIQVSEDSSILVLPSELIEKYDLNPGAKQC